MNISRELLLENGKYAGVILGLVLLLTLLGTGLFVRGASWLLRSKVLDTSPDLVTAFRRKTWRFSLGTAAIEGLAEHRAGRRQVPGSCRPGLLGGTGGGCDPGGAAGATGAYRSPDQPSRPAQRTAGAPAAGAARFPGVCRARRVCAAVGSVSGRTAGVFLDRVRGSGDLPRSIPGRSRPPCARCPVRSVRAAEQARESAALSRSGEAPGPADQARRRLLYLRRHCYLDDRTDYAGVVGWTDRTRSFT